MNNVSQMSELATSAPPTRGLHAQLQTVEQQLNLLLEDLSQLVTRDLISSESRNESRWQEELEGFRVRATTIRRIMDRFHDADLPTRRYLRHHLDEEWVQLKEAYDSLREQFTSKELSIAGVDPLESEGGQKWNG